MKNAYETVIRPNLERLLTWVELGATSKEAARKLGISYSTLQKYISAGNSGDERYRELAEAFARAKSVPDDNVEAALYKRACGIEYEEVKIEQVINRKTGQLEELKTKTRKYIPPDPTSAMFWLTNRRGKNWSYHPEAREDPAASGEGGGVVLLSAVMEMPGEVSGGADGAAVSGGDGSDGVPAAAGAGLDGASVAGGAGAVGPEGGTGVPADGEA